MINMDIDFNLDFEKSLLHKLIEKQKITKKSILKYMDTIANSAMSTFKSPSGNVALDFLTDIKLCLDKVTNNINKIQNLLNTIKAENFEITSYRASYLQITQEVFENDIYVETIFYKLISYSKLDFSDLKTTILLNNNLPKDTSKDCITNLNTNKEENNKIDNEINNEIDNKENTLVIPEFKKEQIPEESTDNSNSISETLIENQLLISEVKECVILPYTKYELDETLNNDHSFSSYQQVIDEKYTIPLSYYKYSSISRFKEAYNLVKKRSHGSIKDAFDIGLEVFFKTDLNPAIITACKNLDELDIYLSCLDDNELDKFKCFDIKFEMLPTILS